MYKSNEGRCTRGKHVLEKSASTCVTVNLHEIKFFEILVANIRISVFECWIFTIALAIINISKIA